MGSAEVEQMDLPQEDGHVARCSAVWKRLQDFEFDKGFAEKLAEQCSWSRAFTARAVEEYRRFVFMMWTQKQEHKRGQSGKIVSPSTDVDLVWHLHMLYTRSYWQKLCGETLENTPLHHTPSEGGPDEQSKYMALYADTLEYYEEVFGCAPPGDIWPSADVRFTEQLRIVDAARTWMIPKPQFLWPQVTKHPCAGGELDLCHDCVRPTLFAHFIRGEPIRTAD